jgi:dipeptidyl aminopeptidase/acylaminoacyl peptidase
VPDLTWTPEVLIRYPLISRVAPSPDGSHIAYTVRVAHLTDDASEFRHQLWLADRSDDQSPRLLAHGESAEQPRWSPEGNRIAFLRKTSKGTLGLWILPIDAGQPWTLTAAEPIHGDIASFCWSPDGDSIAFLAAPVDADKQKRKARRDDAIHYREDFDFAQLFIARVVGPGESCPAPEQRTFARRHITALAWSPDGESIALTHQPNTLYDSWTDLRLATVPAAGDAQQPHDLGPAANQERPPAWSPDGQWIACEAGPERNGWPYAGTVRLYARSSDDRRNLSVVSDEEPTLLGWDPEGAGVYVLNHTGVTSEIAFLPVDGQDAVSVCAPGKLITAPEINQHGDLAFVAEDFHERHSIYATSLDGADTVEAEKVSAPSVGYPDGPLPQVRLLNWRTDDGFEIEGILYLPANFQPERDGKLPLLLHVHGGPTGIFQRQFSATPYYYTPAALCERGMALLRCNPRGSGGYGRAFRFANVKDWGGQDYVDLQQGVDKVIEMGVADPERLGIAGWSYGGFMTSWTITQTSRFKAASIGAAVTNPATFCGTADIPSFIPDYFGGEPWEIADFYREHSPIAYVASANTPSIIQHGGDDDRVPIEQGLQYYNALKRRGVPVDMYIYPRQGHAITEPRLLADAIRRNLEWFTTMLVKDPGQTAAE